MRRPVLVPLLLAAFLGAVWLNQGVPHLAATAILDSLEDPLHHPLDGARYVVVELYERIEVEEIDFAVANATRGRPYDRARLLDRGGDGSSASDRAPAPDGRWHRPYVEFPLEYPFAMVPLILLPSFLGGSTFALYSRLLGALMTAALLGAAAIAIRTNPRRDARERWWALAALLLAEGSLIIQCLDAVCALLLAWALWGAVRRKPFTTGLALGLATAMKLFPVLLVPLVVVADLPAWRSGRARLRGAFGYGLAVAFGFVPMLFPPDSLLDMLRYHAARGLHVESTAGALLRLVEALRGVAGAATLSYGSFNLSGTVAAWLARASTPVMLASVAALTAWLARVPAPSDDDARGDRITLALLSGLTAIWLTAKTFSPQYFTWAIPFVLAASGARGRRLTWLLFATMALTQTYMRAFYGQIIAGTVVGVGFLVVRLPLLFTFAGTALRGARGPSTPDLDRVAVR